MHITRIIAAIFIHACTLSVGSGQDSSAAQSRPAGLPQHALTARQWHDLDHSVDRALAWLAGEQRADGSFPTRDDAQPAVTGLCVLAFLARGHTPGQGPYGEKIQAAITYIDRCQKSDGLLARVPPPQYMTPRSAAHTAIYNHGIGGLALAECYGLLSAKDSAPMHTIIERAIGFTRERQKVRKKNPVDRGGWRYVRPWDQLDADLSITSWQLMFLRSARNAGFEVPVEYIDEGLGYIRRCFDAQQGTFLYGLIPPHRRVTRGMAGAGILSLSLAGQHETQMAQAAGDWLLKYPFDDYNTTPFDQDRFFYAAYYCSFAMFQLGGRYWTQFFPTLLRTLIDHQHPDGSWDSENSQVGDDVFGNVYTTALAVLALTPPYQVLPIFQR